MSTAPGRAPFGRPAIPIDIAAFSYHWSALKITRLTFFFSGLACDSDFLALVDLFFDIFPPASLVPLLYLSRGAVAVPEGDVTRPVKKPRQGPTITV
jgi:hypothetical protein